MFNVAIRFLVNNRWATVVLCTATQPLLDEVDLPERALPISPERRIIQNEEMLYICLSE
jgi:CRISPR-associated endonuclease/helicase Cas3